VLGPGSDEPPMAMTFDTLRAARRLKEAGAAEPVAEAIAEVLRESREFDLSQLATKADLRGAIDGLRNEVLRALADMKTDIQKWVVGLAIAQAALIVALVRLFGHP